jgi:RNA polymerase sigma-70 factor (ECF subfamily)
MAQATKTGRELKSYTFVSAEKYNHLSDTEVIERVLSGETSLFEVLMRRYNQRLFRIQRSYINDEEAIEDTLQLTYLKTYENLDSFRGDAKFSTWITRIAINEALRYLNRQKRYVNLSMADEKRPLNGHNANTSTTPEDHAIQHDFKLLLEKVVGELPPKYRSVYLMREIEDLNTKETAECLEITQSNVKVRLHRAKQMLQKEIKKEVGEAEIFDFMGKRCDRLVLNIMQQIQDQ